MRMFEKKNNARLCASSHLLGFTLLELLTVVVVIAILAGLLVGTAGFIQRKGGMARAESEIAALTTAIENYKIDNGDYPAGGADPGMTGNPTANTTLLSALMPSSGKVYFEFPKGMTNNNCIVDPFGDYYGYRYPGVNNGSNFFDLWSRAGTANTNAWIKNW